ncbi:YsnF/AvaK domain-containing protein [Rathayibacter sp. VKM Ac-2927]|uniref:YsnF/AvaK domain-containing protein n=1 Tax=Rathayibacter sp. VKM Ac-2927 TaxID=2929478 RepID=UPI001FB35684|nr:YsnF/AvaK domain-containing protein [Rathayibacter sp. VKM Ac-2927]MCJ1688574.1 YsnF/AvaK domain-containing protein [Rathayibacter sp. VKM Ac-2927]
MSTTPLNPAVTVIRHEERLTVSTQRLATERVRIERVIVTEQRTVTVDVRREELRITREPLPEGSLIPAGASTIETEPLVMVLHEEQIAIVKTVVPVERVTVTTEPVVEDQEVTAALGQEVVDVLSSDPIAQLDDEFDTHGR